MNDWDFKAHIGLFSKEPKDVAIREARKKTKRELFIEVEKIIEAAIEEFSNRENVYPIYELYIEDFIERKIIEETEPEDYLFNEVGYNPFTGGYDEDL